MKYKTATLFLALSFTAAVPAFADGVSNHSRSGGNFVTFSEGFTSSENLRGASAECNFLSGVSREKGLSASTMAGSFFSETAKGEKSWMSVGGAGPSEDIANLVDFTGNSGVSADKDNGKGKGKGKQVGESGNGNGTTSGSGDPSPTIAAMEPGSQSLVLWGLAGLGILAFRRKHFTNAI